MANEYFVHQQIDSNGGSVPFVDHNQLPHLSYWHHISGRLNACWTECNKALNWRKMWPKKGKKSYEYRWRVLRLHSPQKASPSQQP
jgi:hypothetical protein